MYQIALVDLDNTLYEYNPVHEIALSNSIDYIFEKFNKKVSRVELLNLYRKANDTVKSNLKSTASCHNRLLYFQGMIEKLKQDLGILDNDIYSLPLESEELYWETFLKNIKPFEGAVDFLMFLREKKIKASLVTDLTASIQFKKLKKLDFFKYFDAITTSEEIGVEKPNRKVFLSAVEKIQIEKVKKEAIFVVGDSFEKDIVGGINFGVKSFYFNHENKDLSNHDFYKKNRQMISEVTNFYDLIEMLR